MPNRIEIVCHRGANAQAPENTYAAAQLCLDWGVDYLEVDVRTSRDGVLYILHDSTVDRTTNGAGEIANLRANAIDQLDAGSWFGPKFSDQQVPRLEPFLRWINGQTGVFFDVKDADLNVLVPMVHKYGLEERCFFWFEEATDALAFRKLAPNLPLKMNVCTVADVIRAQEHFGATIVEVALADFGRPIVEVCRQRSMRLMVYEQSGVPDILRQAMVKGVDLLNTNFGDIAVEIRNEQVARSGQSTSNSNPEPAATASTAANGVSLTVEGTSNKTQVSERRTLPHVQHVLLVMFDGCRPDAITPESAPTLHELMNQGSYTLKAQTVMPSITLPCHTSLFYSMPPDLHGVLSNDWSDLPDGAVSLVEVFSDYGHSTAAFHTWEPLRDLAPPGAYDLVYYRRLSEEGFEDIAETASRLISAHAPNFAFVYLEGSDAMGHRHGWMSPEYLAAIRRQDQVVADLLGHYRALNIEKETLVVVMADHGGHDNGHGTPIPEDMTIPVLFFGPTVRTGYEIEQSVSILDVAPTILAHTGLPIPTSWSGQVITDAFVPEVSAA